MKTKPVRRQIFVFTAQEKKAAACVVGALLLGLATKHYRETHPRPPPKPTAREQYQQQLADKRARAYARSARGQREAAKNSAVAQSSPPPLGVLDDEED